MGTDVFLQGRGSRTHGRGGVQEWKSRSEEEALQCPALPPAVSHSASRMPGCRLSGKEMQGEGLSWVDDGQQIGSLGPSPPGMAAPLTGELLRATPSPGLCLSHLPPPPSARLTLAHLAAASRFSHPFLIYYCYYYY